MMDETRARELLSRAIDGRDLNDSRKYLFWRTRQNEATLDGEFTADELEAIAWWMRHNAEPKA